LLSAGLIKSQQYNFKTYNVSDGLGHSQVSQIIQDEKGFLWFTLFGGGITNFDGKNFRNYSERNGLCSNLSRPIIKDHNGVFWIGALGGQTCIYDGKISKPFLSDGDTLPDKVYSILEDDKFNIWFGTEKGIFVFDGKLLKHLNGPNDPPQVPVMHVFQDSRKNIWIAPWEKGIYYYNGKEFKQYTEKDGLSYHTSMGFSEDHEGTVWVSTFKGVSKINVSKSPYTVSKFNHPLLDSLLIFKVTDDSRSKLYFGTASDGMLTYDYKSKQFEHITVKNGLPGNIIYNIFRDHENNLWISCWGFGITKYTGKRFVSYTTKEGLLSNNAQCITEDREGNILVGTGNGINTLNEKGISVTFKEVNNETVYSIVKDKSDGLWFSTSKAVYFYKNKNLKRFTEKDGIKAFPATAMSVDKSGNLWMGSWSGGVTMYDGKTFKNYTKDQGLSSYYIYSIYTDNNGTVWFCNWDGGLSNIKNGNFTYYNTKNGLPHNHVVSAVNDNEGNLWVATYGGGVAKFDGTKFHLISSANGLSDDVCMGIVHDSYNNIIVANSKGLDKIDATLFNKTSKIQIRHYGAEEGFQALECLRNALYEDSKGKVWLGTKSGLYCFIPSEDFRSSDEPLTQITKVRLFFEETDLSKFSDSISKRTELPCGLKLAYTDNHITFNFIGINYFAPEKVRYQFQLIGADKNWSPVTDKTEASYPGLQPGKYIFKLKACNGEGVWNKEETVFEFEILPPWYRTWLAYFSYIVIGLAAYFITIRLRTKKLQEEKTKLEQVVKERTAEIVQQKNLVEEKNKEITDSIQYAQRIQSTLLAHSEFLKEKLPEYFVLFNPKDIVSGDFYWATSIKEEDNGDLFYLAVCDSTGHGVPGAFMSLLNISFMNEAINEKKIRTPNKIFDYVRKRLIQNISQDGGRDGMDGILLCIEHSKKKITYAAAHNKPVLIRDGQIIEMSCDKMPVGQGERKDDFGLHEIDAQKGDMLYLYTDGYADQFGGPKGKKFKYKQLNELLISICHLPVNEQHQILYAGFSNWKGHLEQVDDICIIGIRL